MKAKVRAALKHAIWVEEIMSKAIQDVITFTELEIDWIKGLDAYHAASKSAEGGLRTFAFKVMKIKRCPKRVLRLASASVTFLDEILTIEHQEDLRDEKWYFGGGGVYVTNYVHASITRFRLALRLAGVEKSFPDITWPMPKVKRKRR